MRTWGWTAGALALGLLAAACQAGGDGNVDPISVGDSAPGNCPAGTLSRPTASGGACFAGGGCAAGLVPVRIDGPGGAQVACGQLAAGGGCSGWSAGTGFAGSELCLAAAPCTTPVNRTAVNGGVWTIVLDCTAG
jgi:hypothetical protein